MKGYIFELTKYEIESACLEQEDCVGCPFMYQHGICAKDLVAEGTNELRDLFKFLLKEIDYDYIRVVTGQMENKRNARKGTGENADVCKGGNTTDNQ